MSAHGKTTLHEVNRKHLCPVCDGDHKCAVGTDGVILCGRRQGEALGFRYLGQSKADSQWGLYRHEDNPLLNAPALRPSSNGRSRQATDWTALAEELAQDLTPEKRRELADALGVPEAALTMLQIGWTAQGPHKVDGDPIGPCWTFPELDGKGRVIGIGCRYQNGTKKAWQGGSRGLTVPTGWLERPGPIFLVEGPSDTLALTALNLVAAGRPSNTGGVEYLAELLKDVPAERQIVVLGEWDAKVDGSWPGMDGAIKTAARLSILLRRPVHWALPPAGAKDVRDWVQAQHPDQTCADEWHDLGDRLVAELEKNYQKPRADRPVQANQSDLDFQCPRFQFISSAEFARTEYKLEWLVKNVLVGMQPGVIGGPKKALKTSIAVDLAISLATGSKFLEQFEVPQPVRVALMSGESGEPVLKETALRVCKAKGVKLEDADVLWEFKLPRLADETDLAALQVALREAGVKVLLIDPLYLSLLGGSGRDGPQASNLFEMGPLLRGVARSCLEVGCTPVLLHHFKLTRPDHYGEPQLDDLAFAGIQEFARQWLLLGRREKYEPGTGFHKLWLSVGGSAGHSGLWALDINEGTVDETFGGRAWDVALTLPTEIKQRAREGRKAQQQEKRAKDDQDDDTKLLKALDHLDPDGVGASAAKVRTEARLPSARMQRAVTRLKQAGIVKELTLKVSIGNGGRRDAACLMKCQDKGGR